MIGERHNNNCNQKPEPSLNVYVYTLTAAPVLPINLYQERVSYKTNFLNAMIESLTQPKCRLCDKQDYFFLYCSLDLVTRCLSMRCLCFYFFFAYAEKISILVSQFQVNSTVTLSMSIASAYNTHIPKLKNKFLKEQSSLIKRKTSKLYTFCKAAKYLNFVKLSANYLFSSFSQLQAELFVRGNFFNILNVCAYLSIFLCTTVSVCLDVRNCFCCSHLIPSHYHFEILFRIHFIFSVLAKKCENKLVEISKNEYINTHVRTHTHIQNVDCM